MGTRRDAGMDLMRSNLIPGTVLGIGVGLLLGHNTLWRDHSTPTSLVHPVSSPYVQESSATLFSPTFSSNLLWNPHPALSDEEGILHPLQNALAMEISIDASEARPVAGEPITPTQIASEPQQLPLGTASPLTGNSNVDQQVIKQLIDEELSHLSAQERQTWFESLKDVNRNDAHGILKMWRMLGGPPPVVTNASPLVPHPGDSLDPPAIPQMPKQELAEQRQRDVEQQFRQQNRLMVNTPGYVPLTPVWYTVGEGQNQELTGPETQLNLLQMSRRMTGFPLDLAIAGPGFFCVRNDAGEEFLTRNGQFGLDDQNRLVLTVQGEVFTLSPEVRLKEFSSETQAIQVGLDGQIHLLQKTTEQRELAGTIELTTPVSSASLNHVGNGFFQLKPGATAILRFRPIGDEERGLYQGYLEFPVIEAFH